MRSASLLAAVFALAACTDSRAPSRGETTSPPPTSAQVDSGIEPGPVVRIELQTRALERGCDEVDCDDRTLLVVDSIGAELQTAITARFDAVEFVPLEQINHRAAEGGDAVRAVTPAAGRLAKEDPAVWAVQVAFWTANEARIQEYLFRNDAGRWVDVSPEQVGVTVTMAIS